MKPGLHPGPHWGSLQRFPRPLAGFKGEEGEGGGREGRGKEMEERGTEGGEGRGG